MIIFIFLYYVVWFGSLILAHNKLSYLALLLSLCISSIQLLMLKKKSNKLILIKQVVIFTSVGFSVDCLLSFSDQLIFYANPWQPIASPWILGLWLNFSVLCIGIKSVLITLKKYLFGIALFGFPLSYYGGVSFGLAKFNNDIFSMAIQGLIWALAFPILCNFLIFNKDK